MIPNDYLNDVPLRLELYKRISAASSDESLSEIEIEMIDRFGFLPSQVKNLFLQSRVRLVAESLGIKQIKLGSQSGRIEFREKTKVDPVVLISLVQSRPQEYKLDGATALKISRETVGSEARLGFVNEVLDALKRPATA